MLTTNTIHTIYKPIIRFLYSRKELNLLFILIRNVCLPFYYESKFTPLHRLNGPAAIWEWGFPVISGLRGLGEFCHPDVSLNRRMLYFWATSPNLTTTWLLSNFGGSYHSILVVQGCRSSSLHLGFLSSRFRNLTTVASPCLWGLPVTLRSLTGFNRSLSLD